MKTLTEAIEQQLRDREQAPALFWDNTIFSFADLNTTSCRIAAGLLDRGITPGDHGSDQDLFLVHRLTLLEIRSVGSGHSSGNVAGCNSRPSQSCVELKMDGVTPSPTLPLKSVIPRKTDRGKERTSAVVQYARQPASMPDPLTWVGVAEGSEVIVGVGVSVGSGGGVGV